MTSVSAFDARTGRLRWRQATRGVTSGPGPVHTAPLRPDVGHGSAVWGEHLDGSRVRVRSVDLRTGRPRWVREGPADRWSWWGATDELLLLGPHPDRIRLGADTIAVRAVGRASGDERWTAAVAVVADPGGADRLPSLSAIDRAGGAPRWTVVLPARPFLPAPVVTDEHVAVTVGDDLLVHSVADGAQVRSVYLPAGVLTLVADAHRVYAARGCG